MEAFTTFNSHPQLLIGIMHNIQKCPEELVHNIMRKGKHLMLHFLKWTFMMSRGLPRDKREKDFEIEKKLSSVTKTNQIIIHLSAYLYIGTIAKITNQSHLVLIK